jgi:hypothetical protein
VDAIDELLDSFRTENRHGRRNRRLLVIATASAAGALLIHHLTLGGVETTAWQGTDSPDWAGGSILLFLLAPFAVYLAVRRRESVPRWLIGAVVIPAAALAVGLLSANNRHWQQQARGVFAAYTHRFPPGLLHEVHVRDQVGQYVTVCAAKGRSQIDGFCAEINLSLPEDHQVEGGFRYRSEDLTDPFDCFGDTIACLDVQR